MANFHVSGIPPKKTKSIPTDFKLDAPKKKIKSVKQGDFHITQNNEKHDASCSSTIQYTPLNLKPVYTCSCGNNNSSSDNQTLSIVGDQLSISNGNTVTLSISPAVFEYTFDNVTTQTFTSITHNITTVSSVMVFNPSGQQVSVQVTIVANDVTIDSNVSLLNHTLTIA